MSQQACFDYEGYSPAPFALLQLLLHLSLLDLFCLDLCQIVDPAALETKEGWHKQGGMMVFGYVAFKLFNQIEFKWFFSFRPVGAATLVKINCLSNQFIVCV